MSKKIVSISLLNRAVRKGVKNIATSSRYSKIGEGGTTERLGTEFAEMIAGGTEGTLTFDFDNKNRPALKLGHSSPEGFSIAVNRKEVDSKDGFVITISPVSKPEESSFNLGFTLEDFGERAVEQLKADMIELQRMANNQVNPTALMRKSEQQTELRMKLFGRFLSTKLSEVIENNKRGNFFNLLAKFIVNHYSDVVEELYEQKGALPPRSTHRPTGRYPH